MYVSGTKKMMSSNCTPVHIRRTQKVHRLMVLESVSAQQS